MLAGWSKGLDTPIEMKFRSSAAGGGLMIASLILIALLIRRSDLATMDGGTGRGAGGDGRMITGAVERRRTLRALIVLVVLSLSLAAAAQRFVITNLTAKAHNVRLNDRKTSGGGQKGFSRTLQPHQRTIVLLFLDYRGRLLYFGGLPADRRKPGMTGFFAIV
jgi:hypothetical protein